MGIAIGGNQRDLAREKSQAKAKEAQKGQRKDGVSPAQRQLQYFSYY